jgi:hypothetical protein
VAYSFTNGTHTSPGTPQDDTFRYPNAGPNGYLRLTQDGPSQRSTMIYTADTLNTSKSFSFSAEVRISSSSSGADGLAFFWMSKASVDTVIANDPSVNSVADITGGMGEWQGVPHGNDPSKSIGYYPDISGYSFEFDHYQNSGEQQEYNHLIRIDDWDHTAGSVAATDYSSDANFYFNDGWLRVHFSYDEGTESFAYYLETLDGSITTAVKTFTISDLESATGETGWYETFDEAYFGIGAGTGAITAEHLVDNLNVVPEPVSALYLAAGALALVALRRRLRK